MRTTLLLLLALLTAAALPALAESGPPAGYPLKKCVISDEALGEHGRPVKVTAPDGTEVYLCCKSCLKDFQKDPAKYGRLVMEAGGKK